MILLSALVLLLCCACCACLHPKTRSWLHTKPRAESEFTSVYQGTFHGTFRKLSRRLSDMCTLASMLSPFHIRALVMHQLWCLFHSDWSERSWRWRVALSPAALCV